MFPNINYKDIKIEHNSRREGKVKQSNIDHTTKLNKHVQLRELVWTRANGHQA